MTQKMATAIALLVGLGMVFLGVRFFLAPEVAEAGYGIRFNEQGDYSFHYIKGVRDVFSGMLVCLLMLTKQRKALGITLLAGSSIAIVDMLIVLSKPYNGVAQAMPHISAIAACLIVGTILLFSKPSIPKA